MKILVIDNYDSFTYNLVTFLRNNKSQTQIIVKRNDQISLEQVNEYDKILISPGPSVPDHAGITKSVIETYAPTKSILGICLGHQAIGEVFGANIYNMNTVQHGIQSELVVPLKYGNDRPVILEEIEDLSKIGLYHSWTLDPDSIPQSINVLATNSNGDIMAIEHRDYEVYGLQFHPESILTENGQKYIDNWIG